MSISMQTIGKRISPLASWLRSRPLLGRWCLSLVPDIRWTLKIGSLGPLRVRLRRHRYLWLRDPFVTEAFPWETLSRITPSRATVFDVGANIGLYTRFALGSLRAGHVVAFEPWRENCRLLEENIALVGAQDQVTILQIALGDEDGDALFQVDNVQSTSGTLDRVTCGAPSEGRRNLRLAPVHTRVRCVRLDSIIKENRLPLPDVIKIDAEGAEGMILRGARELLLQHRPRLLVELHGPGVAREVIRLLLDLNYSCTAKGSSQLFPGGRGPVTIGVLDQIQSLYDVEFVVAVPS